MEHPEEMPEQRSAVGTLPLDRPVVVRSNPFEDIRLFIEHLWKTRTSMCRNIYPDEFPRGTKEKHATKEQEDEFILRYFSTDDLRKQGGRFLKQVLYSIAKYNEDNVLSRAAAWAEQYESFYANPGMSTSQIRNVLDEHQGAYFPDSFLCRVVLVINYGLKQLRDMQDKEPTNGTATDRTSPPQAGLQQKQSPVEAPQHERAFFDAARQASFVPSHLASNTLASTVQNPQQDYTTGQPQSEHIRYGPSLLHGQSRGGRGGPRPSQRQENRGRHRRSSGSMHSPQMPMGPMVRLQQMIPINTAAGFSGFDPSLSGFVDAPPGYPSVSHPMPLDDRFAPPDIHANTDYYSPISYARAPKPRMPLQNGNLTHQSINGPGYYTEDAEAQFFQHQIPGSFSQQRSRPGLPQALNSPRVVDPHSFSRFSDERYSHQRPYVSYGSRGGHRSSFNSGRTRRSSIRSGDGWQGQRDSRPFEGPQRRVQSDQRACLAHAAERRYETRENRSQSDIVGEHGYPLQRNHRQSQTFFQQASVPDNDPDWSCGSDFIGHRRVDVNTLVVTNLPPEFSAGALEEYITSVMEHKRVVVTCNNAHKSIAFVRFPTHFDANRALGIRNMTFEGVPVTFRVPFKFWKPTDSKYFPPAHARQFVESGEWYRSRNWNYGSSAGGSYQLREPGRSERSTTTSEAGHQLQTSQVASTDVSYDANSNAPVSEDSATSDVSDTAGPSGGYNGPVLPSLSEASTPQKHSIQDISRVEDGQVSKTGFFPQIDHTSVSEVTATEASPVTEYISEALPVTEYVSIESESPSTQRASSPVDAVVIEEPLIDKESLTEDCSTFDPNKQGGSSPKEDADDSFQTAAETPEASTRIFTPRSTPIETEKSGVDEAHLATPTPKLPNEKALSTAHSPTSITESDDTASITTAGQSSISTVQASDKTAASRSGPKQTESLSPFARQAQAKRKDVKSKSVKSKNKTKIDLEQVKQAKTDTPTRLSLTEHGKPVEPQKRFEAELNQFEQAEVDTSTRADITGGLPRCSEDNGTESVNTKNMTEPVSVNLEAAKTDSSNDARFPQSLSEQGDHVELSPAKSKEEIKNVSEQSKQAKPNTPSDVSLMGKRAVHGENNDPRKSKATVDGGKHGVPTILQSRDVLSKGDQKTLSTLSSVTALLTGALSSIGSSKAKTDVEIPMTSQFGENEPTTHTSATVQSDARGSTTTTQLENTTSTASKKPKKNRNKRKKKPKVITPVHDEDISSTETLTRETPIGSPTSLEASTQPHSSTGGALRERTNMMDKNVLDNRLSSFGIQEGSIIELGPNSVGYRATNAGSVRENLNLNLRGVEGEVEKSRRKMQEMEDKERLLRLRKG